MADPEQMALDNILSNEKPAPREAPAEPSAEKPMPDIPVFGDTPLPEKPKVERAISVKQAHQDKEQLAQGRVRDPETGQFAPKPAVDAAAKPDPAKPDPAKPAAAAPQQEFTEKEKAFLRAAQEERNKRQELERRLAAIEAAKPQEPAKTFWDDPEAALKAHEDRIRAESTNARLGMAEFTARQKYTDFDEKIAVFSNILQATPGLHQKWLSSPDPAEFAYQLGKNHQDIEQAGGIGELRAKIERETTAKVRAEVEAELKAKADAFTQARAAIPESLSNARSTGPANRPVWSGPPSLDEILKR